MLVPGTEGSWTVHLPSGEQMSIFDAAMRYMEEGVPLVVLAGKEYGSGSSRDWAAKGPRLLGVRAVIAESYERIHRSNLVGMGVLPLQFADGQSVEPLGPRRPRDLRRGARSRDGARTTTVTARKDDGDAGAASRARCASTRRRSGSTTATAASSSTSCASCSARNGG